MKMLITIVSNTVLLVHFVQNNIGKLQGYTCNRFNDKHCIHNIYKKKIISQNNIDIIKSI